MGGAATGVLAGIAASAATGILAESIAGWAVSKGVISVGGASVAAAIAVVGAGYLGGIAGQWLYDNGITEKVGLDWLMEKAMNNGLGWLIDFLGDTGRWWGDAIYDWLHPNENFNSPYERAKNWLRRSDPLVLDLDGDGIELVAADGTVLFDHDGDRVAEATGWVAPDDGFLVIDKNGNGQIDDGNELFGDGNPDAFHDPETQNTLSAGIRALRRYDSNRDDVFDAADAAFGQVRVWRDLNQDGVSQTHELFTLTDVGIQSINLTPTSTNDTEGCKSQSLQKISSPLKQFNFLRS